MKIVLLVPLDPVHDIGLKMMARAIAGAGHQVHLLQPDLTLEEIIEQVIRYDTDVLLIGRTLGYGVAELLARFIDMTDAAGVREKTKIGIGGMAIRPELAAELGFDAGFGPGTQAEEVVCFVEGRDYCPAIGKSSKTKKDMTAGYNYQPIHPGIASKLDVITERLLVWLKGKTSPGVKRAAIRHKSWDVDFWRARQDMRAFTTEYAKECGEIPQKFFSGGQLHPKTRRLTVNEVRNFEAYLRDLSGRMSVKNLRHTRKNPLVFNQYGTGCPFMDIGHILASQAWGVDGVIHFDPSWGARTEGFLDGFLTHQEDGTVITPVNLNRIHVALDPSTLWQVRAHRGLNTPETVVLAGKIGADLTKINICYGALAAGTDPARMTVDGYHAMLYAKQYNLPFDVVTNEELAGVPAHKAFAGMLIVTSLALKIGARPILQPLFAYSPEAMLRGVMEDNYIDYNAAKIYALRAILHAPIWPGAPIGFLTHTEDRVQSAITTALHAALASSLSVDAISIASTDEAYSGGPITAPSKIDTLRAVEEAFRFFGQATVTPTERAQDLADELLVGIESVLAEVEAQGDFVQALHNGCLGSRVDGAYPGRAGTDTVTNA